MDRQEDIYQALSAYLDGELSESEARRIEERLLDDAALAKELRALRETRDLLRRLPRAQAPEDFADRVLERAERLKLMHAPDDGRQGMGRRLPRLAAAAAILLVAALGVGTVVSLWSVQSFQERMAKREHVAPPKRKADQLAEADESAGGTLTEPVALAIAEKTDAGREAMAEHELRPSSGLLGDERPPKPTVEEPPDYAALKERLIASADQLWQDLSAAGRLLVAGSGGSVLADQPAVAEAATETIDVETVAILTDDLATAQQDVEAALLRNNLEPVLASDWEVRAFPPKVAFAAAEDSPQAQYMVFVEPEQLPKVQVDVVLAAAYRPDNAIRVLNTRAALPPEVARVQAAPAETETLGVEESDRARLRRGRTSGPSEPVIAEGRRAAPAAMFQADEKARAEEPAELKEPGMPAKHRGTRAQGRRRGLWASGEWWPVSPAPSRVLSCGPNVRPGRSEFSRTSPRARFPLPAGSSPC